MGATRKVKLFVFDLLYIDGYDLRPLPLRERCRIFETLLADFESDAIH
ncbi:hypothetical protein [Pararobbsia alpina]